MNEIDPYSRVLKGMTSDELKNFFEIVLGHDSTNLKGQKKVDKIEFIVNNYKDTPKFKEFFHLLNQLEKINVGKACRYLNKIYGLPANELRAVRRKTSLLLLLYKRKLVDKVDEIRFVSTIEKYEDKWRYSLTVTPRRNKFIDIESDLRKFYEKWNSERLDYLFVKIIASKENAVMILVEKETGRKTPKQFRFRSLGTVPKELSQEDFALEVVEHYPISFKHFYIRRIENNLFELILDFDPYEDESLVESLLSVVLGVEIKLNQLIYSVPKIVNAMVNIAEIISRDVNNMGLDELNRKTEEIRKKAVQKIATLEISPKDATKLREIIENIKILPPKIIDDYKNGIFRLESIVDPDVFLKNPDGKQHLESAFRLAAGVERNKKVYPFLVNKKQVMVLPNGLMKSKRLGKLDILALKLFLDINTEES